MESKAPAQLPDWIVQFCKQTDVKEQEIQEFYRAFSVDYDETLESAGYISPLAISKTFDASANQIYGSDNVKKIRILDIGAGTGLVGKWLKGLGYVNVDGIDCCEDMLQKAKDQDIYKNIIVGFVDEKRNSDIKDGEYDAMISCGSISGPLIQARAFDEMIRWLKKDGIFCFTIRSLDVEDNNLGYNKKFQQLKEEKKWRLVCREEIDYLKSTGENTTSVLHKALIIVYQKL